MVLWCLSQMQYANTAVRSFSRLHQRERRKRIRSGELVSNESKYVGTGFLSQHRQEDYDQEMEAILKEMKRLKVGRFK